MDLDHFWKVVSVSFPEDESVQVPRVLCFDNLVLFSLQWLDFVLNGLESEISKDSLVAQKPLNARPTSKSHKVSFSFSDDNLKSGFCRA